MIKQGEWNLVFCFCFYQICWKHSPWKQRIAKKYINLLSNKRQCARESTERNRKFKFSRNRIDTRIGFFKQIKNEKDEPNQKKLIVLNLSTSKHLLLPS